MSYDPPGTATGVPVYTDGSNAMAADLDLGTHKIVNVVNPVAAQDAATKGYVDSAAGGGQYRQFVYEVSGSDFTFLKDASGNPIMALEDLE